MKMGVLEKRYKLGLVFFEIPHLKWGLGNLAIIKYVFNQIDFR